MKDSIMEKSLYSIEYSLTLSNTRDLIECLGLGLPRTTYATLFYTLRTV